MEAAGFAITVASIASIFQTCVAGYHFFNDVLDMGDAALGLELRFRIEAMRLRLWGESRGLGIEDKQHPGRRLISSRHDVLQTSTIQSLVIDILGRIVTILERHIEVNDKYTALKTNQAPMSSTGPQIPLSEVLQAKTRLEARVKDNSKKTHIGAKIRWAIKDKASLQVILDELTALNDGLERLLPRDEALFLSKGLAGEFISAGRNLLDLNEESLGPNNRQAAMLVQLRQQNKTNIAEDHPPPPQDKEFPARLSEKLPLTISRSFFIDKSCLAGFSAPRMRMVRGKGAIPGSSSTQSMRFVYHYTQEKSSVLAEWRPQQAEWLFSGISDEILKNRREHLVDLLQHTSATSDDFCILHCYGYTTATARLPNGEALAVVGYLYRIPAGGEAMPITLREILGSALESDSPQVPSLDDRFKLATKLAFALYQLHCAGWVHRGISSYNVLFFPDSDTGKLDFTQPYIGGWQYARPDYNSAIQKPSTENTGTEEAKNNNYSEGSSLTLPLCVGDLMMYVHPHRLTSIEGSIARFRKSYDIYSLGILLIEIAFWEPVMAFAPARSQKKNHSFQPDEISSFAETVMGAAEKEIGSTMGMRYQRATLACLKGFGYGNTEAKAEGSTDSEELEPGIEKRFFWRVVDELQQIMIE